MHAIASSHPLHCMQIAWHMVGFIGTRYTVLVSNAMLKRFFCQRETSEFDVRCKDRAGSEFIIANEWRVEEWRTFFIHSHTRWNSRVIYHADAMAQLWTNFADNWCLEQREKGKIAFSLVSVARHPRSDGTVKWNKVLLQLLSLMDGEWKCFLVSQTLSSIM